MKYSIKYEQTAFFRTSHVVNRTETEILIALHGYGQLSEFFIRKFSALFREDRLIVVPEATNYSYLNGFSGRVGANWMTSYEREAAIAANHRLLNSILESLLTKYKETPRITVMGFSQGAATATRWVGQLHVPVHRLVLWSGGFAHDLHLHAFGDQIRNTRVTMVWGDQDEMLSQEAIQKQEELILALPVTVEKIQFSGGHEIDEKTLLAIFAN